MRQSNQHHCIPHPTHLLRLCVFAALAGIMATVSSGPARAAGYAEIDPSYQSEPVDGAAGCSAAIAESADGSIFSKVTRQRANTNYSIAKNLANGKLDATWGTAGVAELPNSVGISADDAFDQFLLADDGGVYAVGPHLTRLNGRGFLDMSYGRSGASDAIVPSGQGYAYTGMALQADGSVVVARQMLVGGIAGMRFTRINAQGLRDSGFGSNGDVDISLRSYTGIFGWSLDADGSIQVATYKTSAAEPLQLSLQRFRAGSTAADPTFVPGGASVPHRGLANWLSRAARVQADGALLLLASECANGDCTLVQTRVRRIKTDGSIDNAFGAGGKQTLSPFSLDNIDAHVAPEALWLAPDGKITVILDGGINHGFVVNFDSIGKYAYQLNADGSLDTTFENGKKIAGEQFAHFLQSSDGRLVRNAVVRNSAANVFCAPTKYLTNTLRTSAVVSEYYSATLNHYFMTAHDVEKSALDKGLLGDWKRTGNSFGAFNIDAATPGTAPVCRFYGGAYGGPNSHFFSAEKFECDLLAKLEAATPPGLPAWRFERDAFRVTVPVNGTCPPNLTPLYRAYNQAGLPGHDRESNHRYTTDPATLASMVQQGWVNEGVHMCTVPADRSELSQY